MDDGLARSGGASSRCGGTELEGLGDSGEAKEDDDEEYEGEAEADSEEV